MSAFESMNEMLSAIRSHFSYWENEVGHQQRIERLRKDLLRFIVDQILESLQSASFGWRRVA